MGKNKKVVQAKTKKNLWLPAAAIAILAATVALTLFSGTADKGGSSGKRASQAESQIISEGESLMIPISELSSTAKFYPVEIGGTPMEIIAVKDSEGNVRTAFNTCQVCYSSGKGYYVQDGKDLVCQNCKTRFTVDQVEIETGGCNPWPIFQENKTVTDTSVSISFEYLNAAKQIFANWKTYS